MSEEVVRFTEGDLDDDGDSVVRVCSFITGDVERATSVTALLTTLAGTAEGM